MKDRIKTSIATVVALAAASSVLVTLVLVAPELASHDSVVKAGTSGYATLITGLRTSIIACFTLVGAGITLAYTARSYRLSRKGQIVDRFSKAIERMGSDREYIRAAGILVMRQIVDDSPEWAPDIGKIIDYYIHRHAQTVSTPWNGVSDLLPDLQQAISTITNKRLRISIGEADRVDFTRLRLPGVELQKADLSSALLSEVDMTGANLTRADLFEATLVEAVLNSAVLRVSRLRSANAARAKLVEATLIGADMRWVNLSEAVLSKAWLDRADISWATLQRAVLTECHMDNAILRGAKCDEADFRKSSLIAADFRSAILIRAVLNGGILDGAKLSRANLTGAIMNGASLKGADLQSARFNNAVLKYCDFEGANLYRADLRGADLSGARSLTMDQIDSAVRDTTTRLP